jgi:ribosomal-protein-alanine N-acetyltransferase
MQNRQLHLLLLSPCHDGRMMQVLHGPTLEIPSVRVERLGSSFSEDCAAIHAKSFLHPWRETEFEKLVSVPECVALGVLFSGGASNNAPSACCRPRLRGFIIGKIAADEGEILTFAVNPPHQRQGIGTLLLDSLKREMALRKAGQLFLEVDEANGAARMLYEKSGFETVGIRKSYYRTKDALRSNALIMATRLSGASSGEETSGCGQGSNSASPIGTSSKIDRPHV